MENHKLFPHSVSEKSKYKKIIVATKNMETISYSNKMNMNLFLFMENWYVLINLCNFNGKCLLGPNNEKPTYNKVLLIFPL